MATTEGGAGSFVVHVLLKCTPGSFEYCGVGGLAASKHRDPRLLDRGRDLVEPFSSLSALISALDEIATNGLCFEPTDPQDADYWDEYSSANALRSGSGSPRSPPHRIAPAHSAAAAALPSELQLDRVNGDSDVSDAIRTVFSVSARGGDIADDLDSDDETIARDSNASVALSGTENVAADPDALFHEQQRHVLLIELQAAVENAEDFSRRCSVALAAAVVAARQKKKSSSIFSSSSSSTVSASRSSVSGAAAASMTEAAAAAPWSQPEGTDLMGRIVTSLDAVFSHGLRPDAPAVTGDKRLEVELRPWRLGEDEEDEDEDEDDEDDLAAVATGPAAVAAAGAAGSGKWLVPGALAAGESDQNYFGGSGGPAADEDPMLLRQRAGSLYGRRGSDLVTPLRLYHTYLYGAEAASGAPEAVSLAGAAAAAGGGGGADVLETGLAALGTLAPVAELALESGVDLAGRAWVAAALASGLIKVGARCTR